MNYVEYYTKKAISIGERDLKVLRSLVNSNDREAEYWLVVLRGADAEDVKEKWKVALMTARRDGSYDCHARPVSEKDCTSFQAGLDLIKEWEYRLWEDRWFEEGQAT
ncbi:hypothetical protein [Thalassobacillus sp. B23F22_16]|uniref:hypothetical protein n=1 Tax=Thalassobacillus sp. B23F22_16 TaxID=3459513 RepID=UPI00373EB5E5